MAVVTVPAEIAPASHAAVIERRTLDGSGFFPIGPGDSVAPFEPIRLVAEGVDNQSFNEPEFIIRDALGNTVFQARHAANRITGIAAVDILAPGFVGEYELTVHAQSFPFFPRTHSTRTLFRVASTPPPLLPSPPEDGGFFEDIGEDIGEGIEEVLKPVKGLIWVGGLAILGVVALSLVSKLPQRR